jgi:N-acetylglucosaminyldiphosphoundecaprenol N-acetyl-beta-D-mannosaminyltransferase
MSEASNGFEAQDAAVESAAVVESPRMEKPRDSVKILGVEVDKLTVEGCLERVAGFVAGSVPRLIVTADASGIVQAQTDPELMAIYHGADLVTGDSIGVLWASKRKGTPLPERVSGVDLVKHICERSSQEGWRIYFLGAAPGVAELAAERLRLMIPGCNIVGTRHGFFPAESDEVVAAEISELKPDVLFVAMGIPRQEKFIRATEQIIRAKVSMGVGGSFDVFSGKVQRAPKPIQRLHLEWLWRLIQNPKKISKVKLLPQFVKLVLKEG